MTTILAGDIGGTKTLLRLAEVEPEAIALNPLFERRYVSAEFDSLAAIVKVFLTAATKIGQIDLTGANHPQVACFGIAGPTVDNRCALTNLSWQLDGDRMAAELEVAHIALINDFAAIGHGVLGLAPKELYILQKGKKDPQAPIGVIGAGSGLGMGYLTWDGDAYKVHASEGGHVEFAPRDQLEMDLLTYLWQRSTHISIERLVSGQGIVTLYQFLRDRGFGSDQVGLEKKLKDWETGATITSPAAAISEAGLRGSDRRAEKTMQMFADAYAAVIGNLALTLIPRGGLYIAGGIAPKVLPLLQSPRFMQVLKDKGRLSRVLDQVPIQIVLNQEVGLLGATLHAASLLKS
ncbi:glucokinase [Thalassoporum mexicanum]|uniref:glucokinase n=1 Tax=Thalassoporum mexicanum TaxID=3457544 RepID=UPI00030EEFDD|nr:glucokinase [Pseudanabaena sp. PCC 7367]